MEYLSKTSDLNYWQKKLLLSNPMTILLDYPLAVPWLLEFNLTKGNNLLSIMSNHDLLLISSSSIVKDQVLQIIIMEMGLITVSMRVITTMGAIKAIISELKVEEDFSTIIVHGFQLVILAF